MSAQPAKPVYVRCGDCAHVAPREDYFRRSEQMLCPQCGRNGRVTIVPEPAGDAAPRVKMLRASNSATVIETEGSLLLRVEEVARMLNISTRSVWTDVAAGRLPRPIKLGAKTTRWRRRDIERRIDELHEQANRD